MFSLPIGFQSWDVPRSFTLQQPRPVYGAVQSPELPPYSLSAWYWKHWSVQGPSATLHVITEMTAKLRRKFAMHWLIKKTNPKYLWLKLWGPLPASSSPSGPVPHSLPGCEQALLRRSKDAQPVSLQRHPSFPTSSHSCIHNVVQTVSPNRLTQISFFWRDHGFFNLKESSCLQTLFSQKKRQILPPVSRV